MSIVSEWLTSYSLSSLDLTRECSIYFHWKYAVSIWFITGSLWSIPSNQIQSKSAKVMITSWCKIPRQQMSWFVVYRHTLWCKKKHNSEIFYKLVVWEKQTPLLTFNLKTSLPPPPSQNPVLALPPKFSCRPPNWRSSRGKIRLDVARINQLTLPACWP